MSVPAKRRHHGCWKVYVDVNPTRTPNHHPSRHRWALAGGPLEVLGSDELSGGSEAASILRASAGDPVAVCGSEGLSGRSEVGFCCGAVGALPGSLFEGFRCGKVSGSSSAGCSSVALAGSWMRFSAGKLSCSSASLSGDPAVMGSSASCSCTGRPPLGGCCSGSHRRRNSHCVPLR